MNKVILIGRLARDPESRITASGTSVTRFTIAIGRGKDQDGNDKGADFINCIAWRKLAENIAKYCTKGSQVALEGRLHSGSYEDRNGDRKYTMDVIADNITFLSKSGQQSEQESGQQFNSNQAAFTSAMNESDPFANFGEQIELSDEDLPF